MALRFLLVVLVASLGCDLPSRSDLAEWSHVGRDWVGARMTDLATFGTEAAEPTASIDVVNSRLATSDLAFEVVVEKLAIDFTADLAEVQADPGDIGDPSPSLVVEDRAGDSEVSPISGPLARLTSAIRLTHQAVEAWRSLVQGSSSSILR